MISSPHATQKRWSPIVLLEQLVKAELDARHGSAWNAG